MSALAIAIEALSWMSYAGLGERTALFRAADQMGNDDPNDLRHAHRLVMEVSRFQNRLEYNISRLLPDRQRETPHGISSLLKILAFLRYVDGAEERDLKRTVFAARQVLGWKELQPYEDTIARIVSGQDSPIQMDNELERLALVTCHPEWFVEELMAMLGRSFALRVLQRNMSNLPAYIRLNTLKTDPATGAEQLQKSVESTLIGTGFAWKLTKRSELGKLTQHVSSGEFVVQDLASILASLIASPKPGDTVLDVCGAPGNKTSHLAALMRNLGTIYSVDVSKPRLSYWMKEMKRTGTEIATPVLADATSLPFRLEADVALVDPPCSNTGVFARNPAIKWRTTKSRVESLAKKQRLILKAASEQVRMGGALVYCTCSVLSEENEQVIGHFLERNPDFELENQSPFLGSKALRGLEKCQRFYPHIHECNGYFIAKLRRTS